MNYTSTLDAISNIEKKICIEISSAEVDYEIDDAFSYVQKNVAIKGFRRGRIPRNLVEQQYAAAISEDVAHKLIEKTFPRAVEEKKLVVVSKPQFDHEKPRKGVAFQYTALFEIKPEIALKKYKNLNIEIPKFEVTNEMLDKRLSSLREEHSILKPVSERKNVQLGDFVELEYSYGGKASDPKSKSVDTFEVKEGALPKEILDALGSASVQDEKTLEIVNAKETTQVWLKVLGIKEKQLPPLDDEFAKSVGACANVEQLRSQLKAKMNEEVEGIKSQVIKAKLIEHLITENDFSLPPSMIAREYEWLVTREKDAIKRYGGKSINENEYLSQRAPDLKKSAEKNIRQTLLLEAVAKEEKISVTDADFETFYNEQANRTKEPLAKIKGELNNPRMRELLSIQLLEEKALALIKDACHISEVAEKQAEPNAAP
jgi:trigger factor